jgi:hypothetical protein
MKFVDRQHFLKKSRQDAAPTVYFYHLHIMFYVFMELWERHLAAINDHFKPSHNSAA